MTPTELDALDADVLKAFVRFMEREAAEIRRAQPRR
jgi:hypothetical protein